MKQLLWFIFCLPLVCAGQGSEIGNTIDSVGLVNRAKADTVLSRFENICGTKMLYSVENNKFYICVKNGSTYQEFYVVDNDSIGFKIVNLKTQNKSRKTLLKAFRLEKYHRDFITSMPDAKFIQGYPSYFVIKDDEGRRYGEFSLSYLTIPAPIDKAVYGYLIRKMSELVSLGNN